MVESDHDSQYFAEAINQLERKTFDKEHEKIEDV